MELDRRTVPNGSVLTFDVCIAGAGPAGLAIAHELAGRGHTVAVVESGGWQRDRRAQALSRGRNLGRPDFRLEATRMRMLGGTSNHWLEEGSYWSGDGGLHSRPLDPCDFAARGHLPRSGWPFAASELAPYYERAHSLLGLGPVDYEAGHWAEAGAAPLPQRPPPGERDVYVRRPGAHRGAGARCGGRPRDHAATVTLSLLALALRLADHVSSRLRERVVVP